VLRTDPRNVLPHRIETKRLVLRAPIRGDVPRLVQLADNRKIASVLARLPSPYTRADAVAFVEIFAQREDERPFAITLEGAFIGIVGFTFNAGEAPELGYWLGEPYWRQGLMTEAARALIETAQATGQYRTIKARALVENAASLGVLSKVGFRITGEAESIVSPGRRINTLVLEQRP
jgi:RimJ/RimL family protein N-acetyltransferase